MQILSLGQLQREGGWVSKMMLSLSYLPSRIPQAVEEKLPPAVVMKLDVEGREVELNIFYANY